jgi:dephospho-CoA kinase
MVPILGIVGGIGSGKSALADELVKLGGYLIAADKLGHEALRQADIKGRVIERWGRELLDTTGEIQRRALGRIVFADAAELRELEVMVFPYIGKRIHEEIAKANQHSPARFIVLDAAIMMETGWDKNCDRVIFVDVPKEIRLERLRRQRHWNAEEVGSREKAQMSVEEKRRRADAIIDNSGGPEKMREQLVNLLRAWNIV